MARYQQGIGVPEASKMPSTFQAPTTWQEPKAPAINRVNFMPANSGANRNYGSTPQYVDTVKSRWEYGAPGSMINAATGLSQSSSNYRQSQAQAASTRGTDTGPVTNPSWSTTQRQRRANWE
jgi:hypothetical protein